MAREVGIRALKNEASALVREVEAGESIVVTRNGHAVARLVPEGIPAELTGLIQDGRISWTGRSPDLPARVRTPAGEPTLADVVIADRGPR
jgi:prevent-host-death family protein